VECACCWKAICSIRDSAKCLGSGPTALSRASVISQLVRFRSLQNLIPAYAHFFAISFTLFQLCGTLYKLACLLSPAGILAYFCPCYVFGKNAEQLGESCVMYALSQFVPILDIWCRTSVRGKIREQKGIEGTCMKDLLCSWCCPLCSLVQEARVRSHASPHTMFLQIIVVTTSYTHFELCSLCGFVNAHCFLAGIESPWRTEHGTGMKHRIEKNSLTLAIR